MRGSKTILTGQLHFGHILLPNWTIKSEKDLSIPVAYELLLPPLIISKGILRANSSISNPIGRCHKLDKG